MKIFISYRRAEDDKSYIVGQIHERLAAEFGAEEVFRDLVGIWGGQEWRAVLEREANDCKVMLVVMGPDWAGLSDTNGQKRLFDPSDVTRWEVETGLQRSRAGEATVIPLLVLDARMPGKGDLPEGLWDLREKNAVRLRNYPDFDRDFETLVRDIWAVKGVAKVELDLAYYEPETVLLPAGSFWMGSEAGDGIPAYETPLHEATLPAYRVGKTPVTNQQYEYFIAETRIEVPRQLGWDGQRAPKGQEQHPVSGVTWYEAVAYCDWLSKKTGRPYTLPNEAQWEKACRGGTRCRFPWGDSFDAARCNQGHEAIAPVTAYPAQNELGLFDLVGNIRQWTCTIWEQGGPPRASPYPWREDGRNNLQANSEVPRVLRGGSRKDLPALQRCSLRRGDLPTSRGPGGARHGFRVVLNLAK
jgi:formylglycine-generating enzyme required for sulfatase activity